SVHPGHRLRASRYTGDRSRLRPSCSCPTVRTPSGVLLCPLDHRLGLNVRFGILGEVLFRDPTGRETRLDDHGFGFGTRDLKLGEETFELLRLTILAFRPAGQIIDRATGEVFHRLDAVLAEGDEHRAGDPVDLA